MSEREIVENILTRLDKGMKIEDVMESPQTEFEDGELISIDLADLALTEIPEDLFLEYPSIKRIHLSFNKLADLPENIFEGLEDLEFINLYGNEFIRLPDDIFEDLDNLEWLDLRSNKLEAIPKSVGLCDGLNYLFLQNNPLGDHPEHNWAADYHSQRDIRKFMPEFQEAMGLEVTMEKPLTREERAARAKKRREERQKKNN